MSFCIGEQCNTSNLVTLCRQQEGLCRPAVKNMNKIRATALFQMWKVKNFSKDAKEGKYKLYTELLNFIETISAFECYHLTFTCPSCLRERWIEVTEYFETWGIRILLKTISNYYHVVKISLITSGNQKKKKKKSISCSKPINRSWFKKWYCILGIT